MDLATIIGVLTGVALIAWSILLGGSLMTFVDIPSVMIVVGGTIAATLINFPLKNVLMVVTVVKNSFFHTDKSPSDAITQIVQLAEKARREGILALENYLEGVESEFLKGGIRLAVDGIEADTVRAIMETELSYLESRHKNGQYILEMMGSFSPAFGMIGTLIGLVQMLKTMDDPSTIGPGMAVALITTFYGALMANLIFIPLGGKLKIRSAQEIMIKELIIEGVMSIQSGDNPRIVEQKLKAFLEPKQRKSEVVE
ncbi:MAG: MotA/TolQ/ExbB proton channel family protein [Candidatus Delongbacteria bacterium]|nr:MotA/TolQ/ExbB proton channel family protein [Candidatus Delongbacteria bacterium]